MSDYSKILELARFAQNNSKYYQKLYANVEFLPDNDEATFKNLPFSNSPDLSRMPIDFWTKGKCYKVVGSSGTLSSPKLLFRTKKEFSVSVQNQVTLMEWCGITAKDVVAIPQPFGFWGYGELTLEACNKIGAMALPLGFVSDEFALKNMETLCVSVIDASPSKIRSYMDLIEQHNFNIQPRIIMLSGEPLNQGLRDQISAFWDCKIIEQYGSEETDALAGESFNSSNLTLLSDHFHFEILDLQTHNEVQVGNIGELVITSLYHTSTPLIRYRIGDLVEKVSPNQIQVKGRKDETLFIHDSIKLYAFQVEECLSDSGIAPLSWQCHFQKKNNQSKLLFVLDCDAIPARIDQFKKTISKSSVDIKSLIDGKLLATDVTTNREQFIVTDRGKTPHFINLSEQEIKK